MKVSQAHHGARARLGRLTAFGCALLTILTCSAADVGAPARPTTRLSSPHQPISGKRPLQPVDSGVAPVGPDPGPGLVRLPGHIPFALLRRLTPAVSDGGAAAMTLTLTLRRDDEVGFRKYLQEVYDPASGQFRHFLTQGQLTGHFGPSRQSYDEVRTYFVSHGFSVVAGSHNHLTLTVRGTRRQVEETLALHVRDFQIGDHRLFINDADPAVPRSLAPHLQAIVGLMTPPTPQPAALGEALVETLRVLNLQLEKACWDLQWAWDTGKWEAELDAYAAKIDAAIEAIYAELDAAAVESEILETGNPRATTKAARASTTHTQPTARAATRGGGQKIGITSSSTFQLQDVADWLALAKLPASLSSQVNKVDVAGGAAPGPAEADTLLAIATILNVAPGAQITVYDAPFAANAASFQSVFNAMINDGVTVISNTNIYCEDQTTLADVQSLDATLSAAAASGVTVLSATGDAGSSCQDGSANTIAVPTDSPHVTAVGGSSATAGPGNVYGTETWFNGTTQVPPIGAAGYGTSRFFNRPDYQSSLISSPMRSVPDVVAFADPAHAPTICQADAGGCPAAQIYGGTSLSTPIWAGLAAVLNQQLGKKLGLLNPTLYSQAAAATFHSASRLSSDPAHVGLGSPNFTRLYL
ncbi:MAG TPA: protease pro-enzyme activation domain-containing protein, partial [Steroidobacteraceae bacterium]